MRETALLQDMSLFVEVARAGNFTAAARRLGMPVATLSRRIAAMERRLRVRLFDRTTRQVALTDPARRYLERCAHLVDEARLAHEALQEAAAQPTGHVRVSAPVDFGIAWLAPLLPEFMQRHPGITVTFDLAARQTNLVSEGVDVAVRLVPVRAGQLIVRHLNDLAMGLYAAPAYLERRGRPRTPTELTTHDCLLIGDHLHSASWQFTRRGKKAAVSVRGPVAANNVGMLCTLAVAGLGIAMLPAHIADERVAGRQLEPVLKTWSMPGRPVQLVLTSRMQPAAVRSFVAFLVERLGRPSR